MCGIAGIFNFDRKPVSRTDLRAMTDIVRHRGPDGEGFWVEDFVGFGHRRLSIIDLSVRGRQPMKSADDSAVITYNGEVYNFRELRAELEKAGHSFVSRSDTEVLLAAYREWGDACVERFNGMFAFAIWDKHKQRLFMARDRYGIKPLYYTVTGHTLLFGSEIKSLIVYPGMSVGVNVEALNEYFSFQNVFTDRTLFEGVKLLPAAHTLSFSLGDSSPTLRQYWDYSFEEGDASEEEYVEELQRLFEAAVQRQLVSDVEIGAYLSGGMDSGAITCVAAQSIPNLKSFTAGFDLSSASGMELAFDERGKAEFLSNRYKTEHYETVLKAGDMERVMPSLTWHLEDLRVGQSYPNFYVSRLASKFVKVVLSGAGGDELFAGYPWRYYRAVVNDNRDDYVNKYYAYWQRLIPDGIKPDFFAPEFQSRIEGHPTRAVFESVIGGHAPRNATPEDYVNTSLYFEIKTFMHGLLLVEDKLSMAHGLETRLPFLDNDLVDFAQRVPVRMKLRNLKEVVRVNENETGKKVSHLLNDLGDGKLILRNALSSYVPAAYTNAAKQGFSAPDASWFKGESIDYIKKLLLNKKALIYEFIQPQMTRTLLEEHFSGKHNHRLLVWSLLSFEWWCRTFLERQHPDTGAMSSWSETLSKRELVSATGAS